MGGEVCATGVAAVVYASAGARLGAGFHSYGAETSTTGTGGATTATDAGILAASASVYVAAVYVIEAECEWVPVST